MTYAIINKNDPGSPDELWGPYDSEDIADQVKAAFVAVPESASVVPATANMTFTGCPL